MDENKGFSPDIQRQIDELREMKKNLEEINPNYVQENSNAQFEDTGVAPNLQSSDKGKELTLSSTPAMLPEDHPKYTPPDHNTFSSGFISKLFLTLLVGFASGAIVTATYIFLHLGKVVVSI